MVGFALFGFVPVDGRCVSDVLPGVVPLGIGTGMAFPALMAIAMADATPEDAGLAMVLRRTDPAAPPAGSSAREALAADLCGDLVGDGEEREVRRRAPAGAPDDAPAP